MGQRTQLYVRENFGTEDGKTITKVREYYNQWGYGYRQLFDAVAYIMNNRSVREVKDLEKITNVGRSWFEEEIEARIAPVINDMPYWKEMVGHDDNNNGIVVLDIYRSCYGEILYGHIACLGGDEDDIEGKLISVNEMVEMFKENDNVHEDALAIIQSTLKYFNFVDLGTASQKTFKYKLDNKEKIHAITLPENTTKEDVEYMIKAFYGWRCNPDHSVEVID